jgi:PleD family two-component response regulator
MKAGVDDYLAKPLDREQLQVRLIAASRVTSLHRQLNKQKAELEKLNEELSASARRDPLTGLGNRLRIREDLETLSAWLERYGHGCCLMLCDIDFFKSYNDTYGHLAGDEVLKRVARVVSENLKEVRCGLPLRRRGGADRPARAVLAGGKRRCRRVAPRRRRACHLPQYEEGATTCSDY